MSFPKVEQTLKVEGPGKRLDLFLSETTLKSRSLVKSEIESGVVSVNGKPVTKPSLKLQAGDEVLCRFRELPRIQLAPVEMKLEILYEDEDLLVLNKEQGWVVHPATSHHGDTVVNYLLHYLENVSAFRATSQTRPGIVHRLDRGTSGALVVAKNRTALERLSRSFKDREVSKTYEAIVWGKQSGEGRIEAKIVRHPVDRKRMTSRRAFGREAETDWHSIQAFQHFSHLSLHPLTGRTHQLRVHLAETGMPIVGDALYGGRKSPSKLENEELKKLVSSLEYPCLHARAIEFPHPMTGEPVAIEASHPKSFQSFLSLLSEHDL